MNEERKIIKVGSRKSEVSSLYPSFGTIDFNTIIISQENEQVGLLIF